MASLPELLGSGRLPVHGDVAGHRDIALWATTSCAVQGAMDGLRAQLEVARHAHLRSAADGACGGVVFGGSAHSGASRAAGRGADTLAEALPGLHAALQPEQPHDEVARVSDDGQHAREDAETKQRSQGQQTRDGTVARCVDALHQVQQLLARSGMFHEVSPPYCAGHPPVVCVVL